MSKPDILGGYEPDDENTVKTYEHVDINVKQEDGKSISEIGDSSTISLRSVSDFCDTPERAAAYMKDVVIRYFEKLDSRFSGAAPDGVFFKFDKVNANGKKEPLDGATIDSVDDNFVDEHLGRKASQ